MKWTTLSDLKTKLLTRWARAELLAQAIEPNDLFPLRLGLKGPDSTELAHHFSSAQEWVSQLENQSKKSGLALEWLEINHRQLGRNKLPCALLLSSLSEAASWLGKNKELNTFILLAKTLLDEFPALRPWVLKNPHRLLQESNSLPRLMTILTWVKNNPRPDVYLRQLSLPEIDTKFIELHKKNLSEWFDLILPHESIDHTVRGSNHFEARYGFKEKPGMVRFRILDPSLYLHDLSDLMITTEAFSRLNLPVRTVYITENDINGLVFPNLPQSIVLFGRGYGLDYLKQADWLKNKEIRYWGDIDTHGFAILNQCRHHLPQTQSFLMCESTLLNHKDHWTEEHKPTHARLDKLSPDETAVYNGLIHHDFGMNVRLEQEFIRYNDVLSVFSM